MNGKRRVKSILRKTAIGLILIFLLYFSFGVIVGGLSLAVKAENIVLSEEEAAAISGMSIGFATIVSIPLLYIAGYATDKNWIMKLLAITSIISITAILLLPLSMEKWQVIALHAIYGCSIGSYLVASSYIILRVEEEIRGLSVALQRTLNILGVATGAPIAGLLVDLIGIRGVWLPVHDIYYFGCHARASPPRVGFSPPHWRGHQDSTNHLSPSSADCTLHNR